MTKSKIDVRTCLEPWNAADAVYFSTVTMTTVGYGDLKPLTAENMVAAAVGAVAGASAEVEASDIPGVPGRRAARVCCRRCSALRGRVTGLPYLSTGSGWFSPHFRRRRA